MSTNLPILNYDFALNQLGGNEALLTKMLGRFVSEFAETAQDVDTLINDGDLKAAKMKVHTVKGISGNLGLQGLYDCATRFDAQLRDKEINATMQSEFRQTILDTCAAISQMEQVQTPERDLKPATLSPELSKVELINRLKRHEFISDDTLNDLVAGLQLTEPNAQALIEYIEELQYPQAMDLIEQHV